MAYAQLQRNPDATLQQAQGFDLGKMLELGLSQFRDGKLRAIPSGSNVSGPTEKIIEAELGKPIAKKDGPQDWQQYSAQFYVSFIEVRSTRDETKITISQSGHYIRETEEGVPQSQSYLDDKKNPHYIEITMNPAGGYVVKAFKPGVLMSDEEFAKYRQQKENELKNRSTTVNNSKIKIQKFKLPEEFEKERKELPRRKMEADLKAMREIGYTKQLFSENIDSVHPKFKAVDEIYRKTMSAFKALQ